MTSGYAIATLVVFVISILFVIRPVNIPTPRPLPHIPINLTTAPILAIALLWAADCIDPVVIRNGIIGTKGVKPFNIVIHFFSLAYMGITLDITGILPTTAFWVSNMRRRNGWQLYLYFYVMFTLLSTLLGKDLVIRSGTAFLAYYTELAGLDTLAWVVAVFAAANTASMVMSVGSPTNLVICEDFAVNEAVFTAYTILPFVACNVLCFIVLAFQYRNLVPRKVAHTTHRDPRSALLDPVGAWVGGIMLGATLILCLVVSFFGIDIWMISLPFASGKFLFDLTWDHYRYHHHIPMLGRTSREADREGFDRVCVAEMPQHTENSRWRSSPPDVDIFPSSPLDATTIESGLGLDVSRIEPRMEPSPPKSRCSLTTSGLRGGLEPQTFKADRLELQTGGERFHVGSSAEGQQHADGCTSCRSSLTNSRTTPPLLTYETVQPQPYAVEKKSEKKSQILGCVQAEAGGEISVGRRLGCTSRRSSSTDSKETMSPHLHIECDPGSHTNPLQIELKTEPQVLGPTGTQTDGDRPSGTCTLERQQCRDCCTSRRSSSTDSKETMYLQPHIENNLGWHPDTLQVQLKIEPWMLVPERDGKGPDKGLVCEKHNREENVSHHSSPANAIIAEQQPSFLLNGDEHFPTFTTVLPKLPFNLVTFAFSQFILIEALDHQGWVDVFAKWFVRASRNQIHPTIWLVGITGVILCNVSGTNIGATILLTKVVRAAALPDDANRAAAIALAIVSNVGAVSFTYSASLADLLSRVIIGQKRMHMRQRDFALWSLMQMLIMTTVGLGIVSAEMTVFGTLLDGQQ